MIENVDVQDFKVVLILLDSTYAYSHSSGWFFCRDISDTLSALGEETRWDTYLFADTCDVSAPPCRTISVSSPERKHFDNFEKSGAEIRGLPSWTLDELKHAFVQMSKFGTFDYPEDHWRHVSEESISTEFEVWGGSPRLLYHMISDILWNFRLYNYPRVDPITFECDEPSS